MQKIYLLTIMLFLNELKETQYIVNSDTIPNGLKNIGYFLHGIKLKS